MDEALRKQLAEKIRVRRISQFGSKSAAYRAAGLNAATWDNAEAGERMRDDRLAAVVKALWPESGGDWTHPALDNVVTANGTVRAGDQDDLSEWLTRTQSELTDEQMEELWASSRPVLEALKAAALAKRNRGSHLGDT